MKFSVRKIFYPIFVALITGMFLSFANVTIAQQAPSLKDGTDKQSILIGEHFTLSVQATFPQDTYSVTMVSVSDSFEHFEVVERKKIDTAIINGLVTCTQNFILTSFDSGSYSIPPLLVNFDPYQDDTTFNVLTDSIKMEIGYSPADSVQTFHDIKPIIGVEDVVPLWIWIAGGALLLIIGLLIWYLVKRKKKVKPEPVFDSKLTPYEEAIQALEKLRAAPTNDRSELKQYHTALSIIFKRYASRKQGIDLSGLTTGELLVKMDASTLQHNKFSELANALRIGDAVKFAKYTSSAEQNLLCLDVVKNTITEMHREIKNKVT